MLIFSNITLSAIFMLLMSAVDFPSSGQNSLGNYDIKSTQDIFLPGKTTSSPPIPTSISILLEEPGLFHQQLISIRGIIKQPELHLDETQLKEHFVFRLTEGTQFLTVFGIHDRTQGAPSISMDQQVEVVGIFYKERILNAYPLSNLLEALTVTPYPAVEPDRA